MGLFDRLKAAFRGTADAIGSGLRAVAGPSVPDSAWAELEEALVRSDTGPAAARVLVDAVRARAKTGGVPDAASAASALRAEIVARLGPAASLAIEGPAPVVWLISGVNGAGKTTTTAKLARRLSSAGRKVLLVAGDTFRAAGSEQLEIWGERLGVPVFGGERGADPASVCFDGVAHAIAKGFQNVLVDTAGRLHTRENLMEELKKIRRVVEKARGAPPAEVLLVLDGTTGQNAISQARLFHDAMGVTGLVVTKLDGSARGGAVLAVRESLGLPVKLAGVGEGSEDLETFDPEAFALALVPEPLAA